MTEPLVQSFISGGAPASTRMAAARGLLPLAQANLLEILVHLSVDNDEEVASAAQKTLAEQQASDLLIVLEAETTAPAVLSYYASLANADHEIHETVAANINTPDRAIALLVCSTSNGRVLEQITENTQRLIRAPAIIDAILANPARTLAALRAASAVRREFFGKETRPQKPGRLAALDASAGVKFDQWGHAVLSGLFAGAIMAAAFNKLGVGGLLVTGLAYAFLILRLNFTTLQRIFATALMLIIGTYWKEILELLRQSSSK